MVRVWYRKDIEEEDMVATAMKTSRNANRKLGAVRTDAAVTGKFSQMEDPGNRRLIFGLQDTG